MKSGNLNFLESPGPLQACNGTALPFIFYYTTSVYVCSLKYPGCNAHAPYDHLWPALLYSILPRYLTNGTIFRGKKLLNVKYVFRISLQLSSGTFLGAFVKLRKATISFVMSVHPSVRPHGTTLLPFD
jgi:hypothetical protein